MTTDQRLVIDIEDITGLRLECGNCRSAVSVNPGDWRDTVCQCPNCAATWMLPRGGYPEPIQHLATGLRLLSEQMKSEKPKMPYRVRLEVERPKT